MAGRANRLNRAEHLATTEARDGLNKLVAKMGGKDTASEDLLEDAVSIGPHRKGGAVLLPEVDVAAAMARQEELEAEVLRLQDELEDVLLVRTLEHLYADRSTTEGKPVEQVARELGFGELLDAG
jgi:hypothetical protein